jgi:long-chain acyl-CoA synthetase
MPDSLFRLWKSTLRRAPKAIAVVDAPGGPAWTRADLDAAATAWAESFSRAAGAASVQGRRVVIAEPNGAGWFQAFLGLLSLGAVPAPVDPAEPDAAQLAAARSIGARWLWRSGALQAAPGPGHRRRSPASEALVKMTSGSSGDPKGLPMRHSQMIADGRQICASMGIARGDVNLAVIPLGYSYGLGNLVIPLIANGVRVVCSSSALPHALASDMKRFRPTIFPAVPPVLEALAASDVPGDALDSVRLVLSAGSPLSPAAARSFAARFGLRVHGFYGTSETGGIAFDASGEATLEGRSVGKPLKGVHLAFGRRGRFTVSSRAVAGTGRFSPADRAALNARGEILLLGRTDRVVKVGGRRVDLAEVEASLRSVPGIREAFALARGEGAGTLCAAVASDLGPSEIRGLLRSRLASWKIPGRILPLREFPRTERGKADARALRQLLEAPRTETSISTLRAARQISEHR